MGNTASSNNSTYGIELSGRTKKVLELVTLDARFNAYLEFNKDADMMELLVTRCKQSLMNNGVVIALFENIITYDQWKRLSLDGLLSTLLSPNGIKALTSQLITVDDIEELNNSFKARDTVSKNGLIGLLRGLFTVGDIKSLPSHEHLELIVSDDGFRALNENKITIQDIINCQSVSELKERIDAFYTNNDEAITQEESLAVNLPDNSAPFLSTDAQNPIKLNRMLCHFESTYFRFCENSKNKFRLLKIAGLDSDDASEKFYKVHEKIAPSLSLHGVKLNHLHLLNLFLELRSDYANYYACEFRLAKAGITQSDMVIMIDQTIAQWIHHGLVTRELVENENVYTSAKLNQLLSQQLRKELVPTRSSLPALSDAEIQNPKAARAEVVTRLLNDQYSSFQAQQADFLKLFSLRRLHQVDESFLDRGNLLKQDTLSFWNGVNEKSAWDNAATLSAARNLVIRGVIHTDEILSRLERELINDGCIASPDENLSMYLVAGLLTKQSNAHCRTFMSSGIIDFYPHLREKLTYQDSPTQKDNDGRPVKVFYSEPDVESPHTFFEAGTPDHALRKIYNTFINHGFARYFGQRDDRGECFKNILGQYDSRFSTWSSEDKCAFKSVSTGPLSLFQKEKTERVLTYQFPAATTRPT